MADALDREVQVVISVQHAINVPMKRLLEDSVANEEDEDEDEFGLNFSNEKIVLKINLLSFRSIHSMCYICGNCI